MQNKREIVNGAQLHQFSNNKVSITGFVTEISHNNMSFDLRAVDNTIVKICLKRPLEKPLEGYVEVHGTSNGKTVTADEIIPFPENKTFDARSHNRLCNFLYTIPNLWSTA